MNEMNEMNERNFTMIVEGARVHATLAEAHAQLAQDRDEAQEMATAQGFSELPIGAFGTDEVAWNQNGQPIEYRNFFIYAVPLENDHPKFLHKRDEVDQSRARVNAKNQIKKLNHFLFLISGKELPTPDLDNEDVRTLSSRTIPNLRQHLFQALNLLLQASFPTPETISRISRALALVAYHDQHTAVAKQSKKKLAEVFSNYIKQYPEITSLDISMCSSSYDDVWRTITDALRHHLNITEVLSTHKLELEGAGVPKLLQLLQRNKAKESLGLNYDALMQALDRAEQAFDRLSDPAAAASPEVFSTALAQLKQAHAAVMEFQQTNDYPPPLQFQQNQVKLSTIVQKIEQFELKNLLNHYERERTIAALLQLLSTPLPSRTHWACRPHVEIMVSKLKEIDFSSEEIIADSRLKSSTGRLKLSTVGSFFEQVFKDRLENLSPNTREEIIGLYANYLTSTTKARVTSDYGNDRYFIGVILKIGEMADHAIGSTSPSLHYPEAGSKIITTFVNAIFPEILKIEFALSQRNESKDPSDITFPVDGLNVVLQFMWLFNPRKFNTNFSVGSSFFRARLIDSYLLYAQILCSHFKIINSKFLQNHPRASAALLPLLELDFTDRRNSLKAIKRFHDEIEGTHNWVLGRNNILNEENHPFTLRFRILQLILHQVDILSTRNIDHYKIVDFLKRIEREPGKDPIGMLRDLTTQLGATPPGSLHVTEEVMRELVLATAEAPKVREEAPEMRGEAPPAPEARALTPTSSVEDIQAVGFLGRLLPENEMTDVSAAPKTKDSAR